MSYVYLTAPYACSSEHKRYERYLIVVEVVARFLRKGAYTYSPVILQHTTISRHSLPGNISWWVPFQHALLQNASSLCILQLEGWDTSEAVKADIIFATKHNIPIKYIEYPLV